MTSYTPEQVLDRNTAAMGVPLGPIYTALGNELVWLHMKWADYQALFGSSAERVALLNRAAGSFFHIAQEVIWGDLLIGIARITDSPRTGRRDNLTIRRLPGLVATTSIHETVVSAVEGVLTKAAFARDWRNRHLAHRDLARAIAGKEAEPLSAASRASVAECLSSLAALLNIVDEHFLGSQMEYELGHIPGGAEGLLRVLRDGVRAREAYFDRLRSGDVSPDEMREHSRAV